VLDPFAGSGATLIAAEKTVPLLNEVQTELAQVRTGGL
jgi:hypothetical protein